MSSTPCATYYAGCGGDVKRVFDIVVASVALVLLAPVLAMIAAAIWLDSRGPVIFVQERIGRRFRPFPLYKFRTMVVDASKRGPAITGANDPRVTRVGRLLRRLKLDELPQLVNIVRGEMSFVGPRPEVSRYVNLFRDDFSVVLRARPGLTDPASLRYRDEAVLLARAADPEAEYVQRILPAKLSLAKRYAATASFATDLGVIVRTVFLVVFSRAAR